MKPSELIKQELNINLKEFSLITEQSENTIVNWFNNPKKKILIDLIIKGIKYEREFKG